MDSDSQINILDQEGNQISGRANDARLERSLSIHEFRTRFHVLRTKEPERRK